MVLRFTLVSLFFSHFFSYLSNIWKLQSKKKIQKYLYKIYINPTFCLKVNKKIKINYKIIIFSYKVKTFLYVFCFKSFRFYLFSLFGKISHLKGKKERFVLCYSQRITLYMNIIWKKRCHLCLVLYSLLLFSFAYMLLPIPFFLCIERIFRCSNQM